VSLTTLPPIQLEDGHEAAFCDQLRDCLNEGLSSELQSSLKLIIPGLIVCAVHEDHAISSNALHLILDLLPSFSLQFESALPSLFEILFDNLTADSYLVPSILKVIETLYDPGVLLGFAAGQTPSDSLVSFIAVLCTGRAPSLDSVNTAEALVGIAMSRVGSAALRNQVKNILSLCISSFPHLTEKLQSSEAETIVTEILERSSPPVADFPQFDATRVKMWCCQVRGIVDECEIADWEIVQRRVCREIVEALNAGVETDVLFELVRDLLAAKSSMPYPIFLRHLVLNVRNRKVPVVGQILQMLEADKVGLVRELLSLAGTSEAAVQRGALFYIGRMVRRDTGKTLQPIVRSVTGFLERIASHEDYEIRRSAVNCYVDLLQTFPGEAAQSLETLTKVQQRLVELYRNRN
jgi:hypothetical protein